MLSDPPPPPEKKVYRLEVVKKKPPVEKKKIQERKKLKRKIPKPLKPIKQPKAIARQEPMLMAKVMPAPVPRIRPVQRNPIPDTVVSPVSSFSSVPITAKAVTSEPRRVQPVTSSVSAVSTPVSTFESRPAAAPVAFTSPKAIKSSVTSNNAPASSASAIVSGSTAKRVRLASAVAPRTHSSPTVSTSGSTRSAWVSRNVQRVALPRVAPQKLGSLKEENKGPGRIAMVDTRSARAFSLPQSVPIAPKSFGSPDSTGTRTAFFEGAEGQKILMASIDPRAVPNFTDEGALRGYKNRLGRIIARNKKYPKLSRVKREEGKVVVRFNILRNGEVEKLAWVSKSPHERLNQEAFNAVKRSAPFAELPTEIPGDYLEIELPFRFELN